VNRIVYLIAANSAFILANCLFANSMPQVNVDWSDTLVKGAPDARILHSDAVIDSGSKLLIWGGATNNLGRNSRGDNIYEFTRSGAIYDPRSNSWKTVSETGAPPASYLPTIYSSDGKVVVTLGRQWSDPEDYSTRTRYLDIYVYHIEQDRWSLIEKSLSPFRDRSDYHDFTMKTVQLGSKIFFFSRHPYESLRVSVFDISSESWVTSNIYEEYDVFREDLTGESNISNNRYWQAFVSGDQIVFNPLSYYQSPGYKLYKYDTRNLTWTRETVPDLSYNGRSLKTVFHSTSSDIYAIYADIPVTREPRQVIFTLDENLKPSKVSACYRDIMGEESCPLRSSPVINGKKFLYLGEPHTDYSGRTFLSAAHWFDAETGVWSELSPSFYKPAARTLHTKAWVGDQLVLWGGIDHFSKKFTNTGVVIRATP
jgi:hypothetical protein